MFADLWGCLGALGKTSGTCPEVYDGMASFGGFPTITGNEGRIAMCHIRYLPCS